MPKKKLSLGAVATLRAVADGSCFGFDIMQATGLTSGSVYPMLDRFEQEGLLTSRWENAAAAHAEGRPARRYFKLTRRGMTALQEGLAVYKTLRPVAPDLAPADADRRSS